MLKCEGIKREMDGSAELVVFADTKNEVPANVVTHMPTIVGLPSDVKRISENSVFYTASLEVGMVKSDGSVQW